MLDFLCGVLIEVDKSLLFMPNLRLYQKLNFAIFAHLKYFAIVELIDLLREGQTSRYFLWDS